MQQFWDSLYSLFLSRPKTDTDSKIAIFSTFLDSRDRLLWTEHMKGADTQFFPFTYVNETETTAAVCPRGNSLVLTDFTVDNLTPVTMGWSY